MKDGIDELINDETFKGHSTRPVQRIKVIGVGGGGNNAVMHMHRKGIDDVSFVLINTDKQVLEACEVPNRVLIGPGLGAGGNPERARKYAEDDAERIAELFDDNTDMVFITAGMGGGTGTGAAPVVARIAKEKGILTVGIVTVPFNFEGSKKIAKARAGAEEMAKNVDSLLVINNQRLTDIYKDLHILNAFAKADDTLLYAAQSITDIITKKGVINRDFNDVDTTLRDGGTAIISTGYGEGPDRVTAAIQDALNSPLLKNTDIFASKKLLMVLYVEKDADNYPFNMQETEALEDFVHSIDTDVDVMWGLYEQEGLGEKVRITLLASGFEVSVDSQNFKDVDLPSRGGISKRPPRGGETHVKAANRMPSGRVLSPDSYDNPDDETLKDIENPAILRDPYNKFSLNRGTASYQHAQSDKQSSPQTEAPRAKEGGITLNFDDL